MIALLDTSEALDVCAMELGCGVKQLLTPLTVFSRQKEHDEFAIDNGAFAGFKVDPFLRLLQRERGVKHLCRFVVVPDVVGDARRTLEVFRHWEYQLTGWPLAFAAQDGIENLSIPWKQIAAIFIGGTTEFKLGQTAKAVIRAAQAMGKYVHVGRVNTPGRFEYFEQLGCDSIDGTGLSRYSWMRERIWKQYRQPNLLTDLAQSVESSSRLELSDSHIAALANVITAANGNGDDDSNFTELLENRADHAQITPCNRRRPEGRNDARFRDNGPHCQTDGTSCLQNSDGGCSDCFPPMLFSLRIGEGMPKRMD